MADDQIDPPSPGLPVTLVIDEDQRVRATVTAASQARVELAVEGAPPRLARPTGADVTLEFVGERGPCRLQGSAVVVRGEEDEHLVRVTPSGPPRLLLLTDRVRAPVEMDIELDGGFGLLKCRTRDLRGGGALIGGPLELRPGGHVAYSLQLPQRIAPVKGSASVVRVTAEGDVAIHFLALGEEDRDDILLAVFEAQRRRD